ncbi:hypothetical protein I317_01008 [Kwoniella heveanensis CBS 569]|nr:hypothetical protein I317_01008 [Kwoniella heveanensis CBS 569]
MTSLSLEANPDPNRYADTIHEYHRQGDISIRSKDHVILWANSWRLADASIVFRDMFELPRPFKQYGKRQRTSGDVCSDWSAADIGENRPIHLDYDADVISTFLDLINVSSPFVPTTIGKF